MPIMLASATPDVQRAPLIDRGHARFEPARRRQIGIDRHDARVAREDLHRAGDDIAGRVFLRAIEPRQRMRRRNGCACRAAGARVVSTGPTTCSSASSSEGRATDLEPHLAGDLEQRVLHEPAIRCRPQPLVEPTELVDAIAAAAPSAARSPAPAARSGTVTLCLFRKSDSAPWPFVPWQMIAVGLPLRGPYRNCFERRVDAVVLRRVDAVHLPVERREHPFEVGHRETPCGSRCRAVRCCGRPARTGCPGASGRRT